MLRRPGKKMIATLRAARNALESRQRFGADSDTQPMSPGSPGFAGREAAVPVGPGGGGLRSGLDPCDVNHLN